MSNQIFFAKSTNQGAPQVTNSWGALVSLLKTILTDGYVVAPVQSVVQEGTDVKVTCTSTHSLEQFQTISLVSNATSETYLTARIVKIDDSTSFTIKVEASQNVPTSNMLVKIPSAGWEVLYSLDNKAVFKPTSTNGPNHFLFVDNSIPSGYTTSHVKFATFGLAERYAYGFTPEGLTNPNVWSDLQSTGTGTNRLFGVNKIFHNYAFSLNGSTALQASVAGDCKWTIVYTNSYFYLHLQTNPTLTTLTYILMGCGNYTSFIEGFNYNSFLSTCNTNTTMATGPLPTEYSGLYSKNSSLQTLTGLFNRNVQTMIAHTYDITHSGYSDVLSSKSPPHLFKVYLKDTEKNLLGILDNLYWTASKLPFVSNQVFSIAKTLYLPLEVQIDASNAGQVILKIGEVV